MSTGRILPAEPQKKVPITRQVFEFFNGGGGAGIVATVVDLHFKWWRRRHPGASFGDYYADTVAQSLRRGGTHKTLGDKAFLSAAPFSSGAKQDTESFAERARYILDFLIAAGLRPDDRCIEYGCGSLRVGQHLIRYLETDHYFGLDLVDDFYRAGLNLLPSDLVREKQPRFGVIGERGLQDGADFMPTVIVAISVLKHVPVDELKVFFSKILSMSGPKTRVFISFGESKVTARAGASIWSYSAADLERCIAAINPSLKCSFQPIRPDQPARSGRQPVMLTIEHR